MIRANVKFQAVATPFACYVLISGHAAELDMIDLLTFNFIISVVNESSGRASRRENILGFRLFLIASENACHFNGRCLIWQPLR